MSDITVAEVEVLKQEVAQSICNLVKEFEAVTNLKINHIYLDRVYGMTCDGNNVSVLQKADLTVELP